ncbi:MAG: hypothetical protein K0R80_414 [Clostridia bacterium]|jgi:hypothetical protein|nr:hypothetical protein [Clostridia bacterium]
MFKRWASFILIFAMMLSFTTVFADAQQAPQVYTITVTEEGGKYNFGNVELVFKKDSMGKDMQPVTFTVSLYAENGVPYIDIEPSVENFDKAVLIKVKAANVEMYDIGTEQTINLELENYTFKVNHFSRYIIIT